MVRFITPPSSPQRSCGSHSKPLTNLDKIIYFVSGHYKDGTHYEWSDYGARVVRDNHIRDLKMMGDVVNEQPYTALIQDRDSLATYISCYADIAVAKSEIIKSLRNPSREIAHIFHNGNEIQYHISIELDDEYETNKYSRS